MPKSVNGEILSILRAFDVAGELSVPRAITQVVDKRITESSRVISFLFERKKYSIVIDNAAEDDEEYIVDVVKQYNQNVHGKLLHNPNDLSTFGLRHKWRDTYLFEYVSRKRRLDVELSSRYPELSRTVIQKYIKAGNVTVNGQVVKQPKSEVVELDELALNTPEQTDYSDKTFPIIYIDDHVIVVNKPEGVLTHSKGALNDEFTVADFFRRYTTYALDTNRPGVVHRLDRDTSGVLIGARDDETAQLLKKQFTNRSVKKEYFAIVTGHPKAHEAVIDVPIGRNPSKPSTFRADVNGKTAQTQYKVLASNDDWSFIHLAPKTGRTHQLRVHMQYLHTPILGDKVYGSTRSVRMFLHAYKIEVTIPVSKRVTFSAPVPNEMIKLFPGAVYE